MKSYLPDYFNKLIPANCEANIGELKPLGFTSVFTILSFRI
jgi:hypothetical protein